MWEKHRLELWLRHSGGFGNHHHPPPLHSWDRPHHHCWHQLHGWHHQPPPHRWHHGERGMWFGHSNVIGSTSKPSHWPPTNGDHPREGEIQKTNTKQKSRNGKHSALSDWFVQISWIYVCFLFMVSSFCFSFWDLWPLFLSYTNKIHWCVTPWKTLPNLFRLEPIKSLNLPREWINQTVKSLALNYINLSGQISAH